MFYVRYNIGGNLWDLFKKKKIKIFKSCIVLFSITRNRSQKWLQWPHYSFNLLKEKHLSSLRQPLFSINYKYTKIKDVFLSSYVRLCSKYITLLVCFWDWFYQINHFYFKIIFHIKKECYFFPIELIIN